MRRTACRDRVSRAFTESVGEWQTIKVQRDVPRDDIDKYLALAAAAHGIDQDRAFPLPKP